MQPTWKIEHTSNIHELRATLRFDTFKFGMFPYVKWRVFHVGCVRLIYVYEQSALLKVVLNIFMAAYNRIKGIFWSNVLEKFRAIRVFIFCSTRAKSASTHDFSTEFSRFNSSSSCKAKQSAMTNCLSCTTAGVSYY